MTQATHPFAFPDLLTELHKLPFKHRDGDGIDFIPFAEFMANDEVEAFLRPWTGNDDVKGDRLAVFGRVSQGGIVAFWIVSPTLSITDQPVIYLGAEGEHMVIAKNFDDYLWLLAGNHGAHEAFEFVSDEMLPNPGFTAFAEQYSASPKLSPETVVAEAKTLNVNEFTRWVHTICR